MKFIVFGNGIAGINTAMAIINENASVKYVYEYGDEKLAVKIGGIRFFPDKCKEIDLLDEYMPDVVISSGWQRKITSDILENWECYNIHPSLLPKYRGIGTLERQLREHEPIGGLTMHKMDTNFDTGPIYKQLSYKISKDDNIKSLLNKNYIYIYIE